MRRRTEHFRIHKVRRIYDRAEGKFSFNISYETHTELTDRALVVAESFGLGVDEAQITSAASFTNDLGADSLDTVELVMEFEKAFNVQIPDEDAEKISTVGDAVNYLTSKIS